MAGPIGQMSAGHSRITLHDPRGNTFYYGLWKDGINGLDNGPASDLWMGREKGKDAYASRYYSLNDEQKKRLIEFIVQHHEWSITNNCSSWVSDAIYHSLGVDIDADEAGSFGIETPRELLDSIKQLEKGEPTRRHSPASVPKK